jgi:hypothetical protein
MRLLPMVGKRWRGGNFRTSILLEIPRIALVSTLRNSQEDVILGGELRLHPLALARLINPGAGRTKKESSKNSSLSVLDLVSMVM